MNKVANINVKIAPYPFTTLRPNLAIVEFDDFSRVLLADIPGIIEGAHLNKGLGFAFLKHIERTSALIFVIDLSGIDGRDPTEDFVVLQQELESYSLEMKNKPFVVALNKMDTIEAQENLQKFKKNFPFDEKLLFEISALNKEGFSPLIKAIQKLAQINGKDFNLLPVSRS
jgi:GTP-binding protein